MGKLIPQTLNKQKTLLYPKIWRNTYVKNEAKKNFKNWTKEGLEFLLQNWKSY